MKTAKKFPTQTLRSLLSRADAGDFELLSIVASHPRARWIEDGAKPFADWPRAVPTLGAAGLALPRGLGELGPKHGMGAPVFWLLSSPAGDAFTDAAIPFGWAHGGGGGETLDFPGLPPIVAARPEMRPIGLPVGELNRPSHWPPHRPMPARQWREEDHAGAPDFAELALAAIRGAREDILEALTAPGGPELPMALAERLCPEPFKLPQPFAEAMARQRSPYGWTPAPEELEAAREAMALARATLEAQRIREALPEPDPAEPARRAPRV